MLSIRNLSDADRTALMLRERALALYIFDVYEHNLYQWRHAMEIGDHERARFFGEVLDYLTGRLLRNPRLLYYWNDPSESLKDQYESWTNEHYARFVLGDKPQEVMQQVDATGPFRASIDK